MNSQSEVKQPTTLPTTLPTTQHTTLPTTLPTIPPTTQHTTLPTIPPTKDSILYNFLKSSTSDSTIINSDSCKELCSTNQAIYSIFHSIMFLIALFLSMRCNNGFNLGSFLVACICPYIYIIFILLTEYDKGICGLIPSNK